MSSFAWDAYEWIDGVGRFYVYTGPEDVEEDEPERPEDFSLVCATSQPAWVRAEMSRSMRIDSYEAREKYFAELKFHLATQRGERTMGPL